MRSYAISVLGGARSAVTVRGLRPEHDVGRAS
jgi:hypothetical protein